ncbi:hypothetical protein ACSA002_1140 [Salmonella phage vB_SalM_SA002]|nr:hypothetical protein ACSA002_1140 [Salmonella phage vB_SalM_SA002]
MEPLNYRVLIHITCDERPELKLIGVCNYDLYVTQERLPGLSRELVQRISDNGEQFNVAMVFRGERNVLNCDVSFTPIDPSEMSVPDPNAGPAARLPKSVNTCINISMKDVHQVLYPLTKPVGC